MRRGAAGSKHTGRMGARQPMGARERRVVHVFPLAEMEESWMRQSQQWNDGRATNAGCGTLELALTLTPEPEHAPPRPVSRSSRTDPY